MSAHKLFSFFPEEEFSHSVVQVKSVFQSCSVITEAQTDSLISAITSHLVLHVACRDVSTRQGVQVPRAVRHVSAEVMACSPVGSGFSCGGSSVAQ